MTNNKLTTIVFLLYSLMINNRGKKPSELEEQINRKKMFAGYIVNKTYSCDLNVTNDNTVSSVVPFHGH
jgi:hypothetical protein